MLRSVGRTAAHRTRGAVLAACFVASAVAHGCSSPAPTPDTFGDSGAADAGDGGCEVARPRPDAGVPDAAACGAGGAGACKPGDVSAFQPAWKPPTGLHQGACEDADVSTIVDCIFDAKADPQTCAVFMQGHQGCHDCLFTPLSASTYGPLVVQASGVALLNTGGCVALLEPCNIECAKSMSALQGCVQAACAASCPATDAAALQACETEASECGCATLREARSCYDAIAGRAGPAAICEAQGASFSAQAVTLGRLFCGK